MALAKQPMFREVRVKWVDSCTSADAWEAIEDLNEFPPPVCHTIGYVVEDTGEYIVLCQSKSDDEVMGLVTIPRPCILETLYA